MSFQYQTSYTLNKSYYQECYEQSAVRATGVKAYARAIFLLILGFLASSVGQQGHLAMFIIVLGVVEAAATYWQQTWWVWRQLISKEANGKVELVIDEAGVSTSSFHHKLAINWDDLVKVESTEKGFILHPSQGRIYLSNSALDESAMQFLEGKCTQ